MFIKVYAENKYKFKKNYWITTRKNGGYTAAAAAAAATASTV